MKQESNNSKVYLDQEELNVLVKEVKETVVAGIDNKKENGKCILTGKPSEQRVVFAVAYCRARNVL